MRFLRASSAYWFRVGILLAALSPIQAAPPAADLTQFSLEDLMSVKVTSVARKEQKLSTTGASVYVITQEDIRRSGMTSMPELLRMVPGINVARLTANTWAISIRGFADQYAGKVLVLVDGRSVYTQEFSGVFWDQQTLPLEEIDRIEVIRGPGGTVWGANAMNGVINIITKKTEDTQGAMVSLRSGSQDSAGGYARFGGKLGDKVSYRVFANYFNIERSSLGGNRGAAGDSVDGWNAARFGFRTEAQLSPNDLLTVQGDTLGSGQGLTSTNIQPNNGYQSLTTNDLLSTRSSNLLARWNHTFANSSDASVQVFYSDAARVSPIADDDQDTADFDFQYHFRLGEHHDLVSGLNYRHTELAFKGFWGVHYTAPTLSSNLFSAFLQDEIKLSSRVAWTVGSKIEHNSFTGFEFEPSTQLVWVANPRETLWVSAARAIQQPSWVYANAIIDAAIFPANGGVGVYRVLGNPNGMAAKLNDFSGGYRKQISQNLSLDVSVFRSYYSQLVTIQGGNPFFELSPNPPHVVLPGVFQNMGRARNYGLETSAIWQATKQWRLSPGYSFLQMKVMRDADSNDQNIEGTPGNSPKHQLKLRSTLDLPKRLEWDVAAYYTSGLHPNLGLGVAPPVAGATRLDTRIGWHYGESLEFSITGQNLLGPRRYEFPNSQVQLATPVQRAVVGKITWRI